MTRDRLRYFRVEARELLDQLGQAVLELERGAVAAVTIPRMLRLAHTLKGAARVVKQTEIADRAHATEAVLSELRDGGDPATRPQIERLLTLLDDMSSRLAALTAPSEPGTPAAPAAPDDLFRAFRPDIHEMDGLLETLAEARGQLGRFDGVRQQAEQTRHLADLLIRQSRARGTVDVRSLDQHKNRLLIDDLRSAAATVERDLGVRISQLDRDLREARASAERLRLVPAHALFPLLDRTLRDTALALGRRARLDTRGGDVRLDAQVLGIVQSALLQGVRNAVAHGIEPPGERAEAGKTAEGLVDIHVARRGSHVVFACHDDGRGVDVDAVRSLAERKGLLAAGAAPPSHDELMTLLLKGGLSTSGAVTNVAGRGVGLDVVRESAARVGGTVTIRTQAGRGTTLEIVVPLTLASLRGLVVEAGGTIAILPLEAIGASLRLTPQMVAKTPDGQALAYDGAMIPLASLARALGADTTAGRDLRTASAVVVKGQAGAAAFTLDRILGAVDVVVRPLPALAPCAPIIAGASLDDDGTPQPVLDPDALVAAASALDIGETLSTPTRLPILVVDDSLTTRMLEQSILESAGYTVALAASGEEGLEKARATRYALFLVDVEMPGMDGFTFIERARSDPALRETPSVLVTSRDSAEDKKRGKDVGARAYVVKSEFDQGVLLHRIRELVG